MKNRLSLQAVVLLSNFVLMNNAFSLAPNIDTTSINSVAGAIQFDTTTNTWPNTITPIQNLRNINYFSTLGNYSYVLGCLNPNDCYPGTFSSAELIAVNNGKEWNGPQKIQDLDTITGPFIPMFPKTKSSPMGWVLGLDESFKLKISFYNGSSFLPAVYVPLSKPAANARLLESHQKIWLMDYDAHRVFSSSNTTWDTAASLPAGNVITVVSDFLTEDLYALELDTNKNQYFLTHLLTSSNQWDTPVYINNFSPSDVLTDLIVINGGKTIGLLNIQNADSHIYISHDAGHNFMDTGPIPNAEKVKIHHFGYAYNGNNANIFWDLASLHSPSGIYDTVEYMDPNAQTPTWNIVSLPAPIKITSYFSAVPSKSTSDDGTQLWVYGSDPKTSNAISYYYDTKLNQFINTTPNNIVNQINFIQAANKGKAYGFGKDSQGNYISLYFDGSTWKGVKTAGITVPPIPSGHYRNDGGQGGPSDYNNKYIVEEPENNTWLVTYANNAHVNSSQHNRMYFENKIHPFGY